VITTRQRQLPSDRGAYDATYGVLGPNKVTVGKVTLLQAVDFLNKHQADKSYNAEKIAADYKLDVTVVKDILDHFSTLIMYTDSQKSFPTSERTTQEKNPLKFLRDKIDSVKD